ncbi:MAG TPA: ABC transporter permease subunit, partial [Roseiarcus sp.]|nr:ABC transporter permease subunit [Roseiarcus sp.]
MTSEDFIGYAVPALTLGLGLFVWEGVVRFFAIPPYLLPAPSVIISTLFTDWWTLSSSLWVTLSITLKALLAAVFGSVTLAVIFAQSRLVERAFYPFAVALQVTPIVAIAPLLLIYLTPSVAVLVCAFLVAFFPLLANTTLGLSSADHNLVDLFQMYRATRLQQFMLLRLPSALPYFLAGLRISGGLALIGAIVAEIAAGSAGQGSGLAYRIVESGFRLNIPRM